MSKNIMIVGVGGQGTLLASRIMGNVYLKAGYEVKMSEVHGMAQRGGSVVTYVKYGHEVYSPVINEGEADVIMAFEELEAYRWVGFLKEKGRFIINTQKILPMPVITGAAEYPTDVVEEIKSKFNRVTAFDALAIAKEVGSIKAVNVVLLGVFAKNSHINKSKWIDAIKETVPEKFIDINMKAFEAGYAI